MKLQPVVPFYRSVEHDLAAGHGDGLAGFVLLLDGIEDGARHVGGEAAAVHGHLGLVIALHVLDGLGAGHLAGVQILHEQAAHRIHPQRAVQEVAGADGVDLDVVGAQLEREALRQADAAELGAGIGEVLVGAFQAWRRGNRRCS